MAKRIVLTGGGTGGHIFPLVAVAEYIKEHYGTEQEIQFMFMGPKGKMEQETMDRHGIAQCHVMSGKLRRYISVHYIMDLFKLPVGLLQAAWHLWQFMPDVVFSKGGFTTVPVVMMARLFRIPVLIHESDAMPGLANKFLGSIANRIAVCFERAKMFFPVTKTVLSGMPIKKEAMGGDPARARELLKLPYMQKPVVLFLGGSQGAKAINQQVVDVIQALLEKFQVIHQTGQAHYEIVCNLMKEKGIDIHTSDYRPIAFMGPELADILALADVVVSRAGFTFIAEIAANKKPAILIPIAGSANGHQRVNAYEVAKAGGAIVLEEDNFKRGMLLYNLNEILNDATLKKNLSENMAKFYSPDAAKILAEELMQLAG